MMNSAAGTDAPDPEEGLLREQKTAQSGRERLSSECDGQGKQPKVRKPYTITKARERWTDHEHARFLEGLSLYGRSWGKVAQHVQTKTTIQIRSHAQKYFNRMKKQQERQPSSTMWQNCSDRSKAFLQSWQASGSTAPTTDGVGGTTASEPFQRAAEIVAAAATEAAAAAASVVVSAASKRIKEHLESMYSSASGPDSFGNLSALPGLLGVHAMYTAASVSHSVYHNDTVISAPYILTHSEGAQAAAVMTEAAQGPTDTPMATDDGAGNARAQVPAGEGAEGTQQGSRVNNMQQSIESAIVLKAMQRISSLFQPGQALKTAGGLDATMDNAANNAVAQPMWLPGSGGSSAFVSLGKLPTQGTSDGRAAPNTPAAPSQSFPTLHQPTDGAFCGESDVMGDVQKEVNSGGGTSQAFSEVGVDGNSKRAAPPQPVKAAKTGSPDNDSGSSHVSEAPSKAKMLLQQQNRDALPATSAPGGSANSRPTTGSYCFSQQNASLSQLPKKGSDSQLAVSPDGVVLSLGQTLGSLNPTALETQTFECLAPSSGGHPSVNEPSNGASVGNKHNAGNGNSNGNSNGNGSNGNGSNGNGTSGTNGIRSNGTSMLASNGSNGKLAALTVEAASQQAQAALTLATIGRPEEESRSQPATQPLPLPLAGISSQQQLPTWKLTGATGAPQGDAAFAALQSLPQAGLLDVSGQIAAASQIPQSLHAGVPLQVATCGVQPQQSSPSDAAGMCWWPPGMSMQSLVNLMVAQQVQQGSQLVAQMKQATGEGHPNGLHGPESANAAPQVHADGN